MSGIATAVVTAAVIGGVTSSNAAKSAAKTQAAAADRATAAQQDAAQRQMELQEPFRQAGMLGQNRLLTLMGLQGQQPSGPTMGIMGGPVGQVPTSGSMVGGDINSRDFGKYARDFGMGDYQEDPGYAFRMREGMKALDRTAAARGGLLSGATLKGAQRYGQDMASQEYQNAFNRYQVNRANQLNPLQSLAGQAQSAAGVMGNAAQTFGQQAAENAIGAGNARASGYVGQANAWNNAIGQGVNQYSTMKYMNMLNAPKYGQAYGGADPSIGPQLPTAM